MVGTLPNRVGRGEAPRIRVAPSPQPKEVVSTEPTLKRAFAWLAEYDTSPDDPELYAQMTDEWVELAREFDVEPGAFRRSCLAVLSVMHDMVTDPPALFTATSAIAGAQALYATLIRGVFGLEYARWRANSQG